MTHFNDNRYKRAFSLTELVVVAVILIAVFSIALIRISGSRESARRMECESNLRKTFLAMQSYSLQYGNYPIGTQDPLSPIRSQAKGYHHNWATGLLPMLDRQEVFDEIDFRFGVYAQQNAQVIDANLPSLRCAASAESLQPQASTYAAVHSSIEKPIDADGDGMFLLNRPLSQRDATDGASYVLILGEKSVDFGQPVQWNSGTRASLRNTGHPINAIRPGNPYPLEDEGGSPTPTSPDPLFVGGFSSNHIGGAYFLLLDGSFRFIADDMDLGLLQQLAGRADQTTAPSPDPGAEISIPADDSSEDSKQ